VLGGIHDADQRNTLETRIFFGMKTAQIAGTDDRYADRSGRGLAGDPTNGLLAGCIHKAPPSQRFSNNRQA
jgi:hypothetical protein